MSKTSIQVKLIGEDGNIFHLLGVATHALKRTGYRKEADELLHKIFDSEAYEDALNLIQQYVEVY